MEHARKCTICGKEYSYCPFCAQYKHLPKWMVGFDTENCKDISNIVANYRAEAIDKATAKDLLSYKDLTVLNGYNPFIEGIISEINGSDEEAQSDGQVKNVASSQNLESDHRTSVEKKQDNQSRNRRRNRNRH